MAVRILGVWRPTADWPLSAPVLHTRRAVNRPRSWKNCDENMSVFKLIVGIIINPTVFRGLLFLPAGTLDWRRAWVLLGVVFFGTVASIVRIFRVNQGVLVERFKPPIQKGQPLADKIVVSLLIVTFVGLIAFIPLDVFRFHLMGKPGTLISSVGLPLLLRVGGSPPSP